MRVTDPPYDLVVLVACADLEKLVGAVIERGEEMKCLAPTRFRIVRDPMRDQVCQAPERLVSPFLGDPGCRFLILWDHQGSGRELREAASVEAEVAERLERNGVEPGRVAAIALQPELEVVFPPVWDRVAAIMAQRRSSSVPSESDVLKRLKKQGRVFKDMRTALVAAPKETLEALIACLRMRRSPALYETLGRSLSIRLLKGQEPASRVATALETWFPGRAARGSVGCP